MARSYYQEQGFRSYIPGSQLPVISTDLDSHRPYQFEIQFENVPGAEGTTLANLTLAAKQVAIGGITSDVFQVDRVNDKVYYPGKATIEDVTVTFDHQYIRRTAPYLWDWYKSIYNPETGVIASRGTAFKANKMTVLFLDNARTPRASVEYYGVFPMSMKFSEANYSTTDSFATILMTFKVDFMDYQSFLPATAPGGGGII